MGGPDEVPEAPGSDLAQLGPQPLPVAGISEIGSWAEVFCLSDK